MARQPRFVLPGHPQHVIQRGNNRSPIFAEVADYCIYKDKLGEACARFSCRIHAYVLMTNHVHLLITPETEQVSARLCSHWDANMSSITIIDINGLAPCGKGGTRLPCSIRPDIY